ncbi:hypothetical protein CEXT_650441 [Caerostris extrusa]|uniref:Uncharacterized protein n=1 Tax=Caerostris extrusa TaxID=172846 RepID=A0AAV4WJU7_CAEEX|nr:hypothetical protein CEXT_650441 [Caerostris extrusa]
MHNVLLIDSVPYIILKLPNNEENRSTSTPENKSDKESQNKCFMREFFQFFILFFPHHLFSRSLHPETKTKEDDCSALLYPLPWDSPTSANYLFSALLPSHPVKDRSQEIRESCKSSEGKNFLAFTALYTQKQRLHKEDDCSTPLVSTP